LFLPLVERLSSTNLTGLGLYLRLHCGEDYSTSSSYQR
jgi:hypothetical protein